MIFLFFVVHTHPMNPQQFPYIDRVLQQAIENDSTPGIALLVAKDGAAVYRRELGFAQFSPILREMRRDTIFDLASLTKVVATTTAVMFLLYRHTITLQDSIKKYVPELIHGQITFAHLLSHSAGFPEWLPLYEDVQQEAERQGSGFIGSAEAKRLIIEKACRVDLAYQTGTDCKYSDLSFILLGHAVEKIVGATLDQYCEQMIFQPLQMSTTFFHKHNTPIRAGEYAATEFCDWRQKVICGEVHDENTYAMGGIAGHAGLFSTLDDIYTFMNTLQQCYHGDSDFLPKPLVRQFFTNQHITEESTYALGWDTPSKVKSTGGTLLSPNSVGHTGFTGTSIWLDLRKKLLVLLFANRIHPSRQNHTFLNMRPKIHDAVVISTD